MKIVPDCAIEAAMPPPNTRSAVDALLKLRGVAFADVLLRVRPRRRPFENAMNDAAIASDRSSVGSGVQRPRCDCSYRPCANGRLPGATR
ncbi:hypothetical protein [Burkholderia ambifaria]|uniref:hypothetical protein n=1 Tax=Burkholderia ambifaria TaxID=152480 RepID=UPI00158A5371|nr:hypothetical protein [Burkholderia ambifaria]